MATVQRVIASAEDGLVQLILEYDDSNNRTTGLRCINNGPFDAYGEVVRQSDGLLYGQRFRPGTFFINIPTNVAARIQLSFDPAYPNHIIGYQGYFEYPYLAP